MTMLDRQHMPLDLQREVNPGTLKKISKREKPSSLKRNKALLLLKKYLRVGK
jgi:hypothetical protein